MKLRANVWPVEPRRARFGLLSSRSEMEGVGMRSRGARGAPGQPHSNSWAGGSGSVAGWV